MEIRRRLRDSDIRRPLHRWLLHQHASDPDTNIIHELKLPRNSARVDVAVVNGEIAAFEIKSDTDSLARLPRQVSCFNMVFDKICIVTTHRHQKSIENKVPQWWGIAIAQDDGVEVDFISARKGRRNPNPDVIALLHALYVPELLSIVRVAGIHATSHHGKSALIEMAAELAPDLARNGARDALRKRHSS